MLLRFTYQTNTVILLQYKCHCDTPNKNMFWDIFNNVNNAGNSRQVHIIKALATCVRKYTAKKYSLSNFVLCKNICQWGKENNLNSKANFFFLPHFLSTHFFP